MSGREENLPILNAQGFRVASWLPTARSHEPAALRPIAEICARALALKAVCFWVAADPRVVPSSRIMEHRATDHLDEFLTEADQEIIALSRSEARRLHLGTIGWRLENIWPLAWILGFEHRPTLQGMVADPITTGMLRYLPRTLAAVASARVRAVSEVDTLEDLFYCAHNAARSAQLGEDTVPPAFDPVADGGVIHERRHALTWSLSPGVAWDDTDLGT